MGKDVAKILGYKRPVKAINDHVKEKHRKTLSYKACPNLEQALWNGNDYSDKTIINESGLYELILRSHAPLAEEFQDWVTEEVLPSIRKHGAYATPVTVEKMIADSDFAIELLQELKNERKANKQLRVENKTQKQQINEMQPKVSYYDKILANKELLPISVIAKDYGMSAKKMNNLLHELKVQYKQGRVWLLYTKYQTEGYTKTFTENNKHAQYTFTKWTQKGRLFLYELLKQNGYLPLIEQNNVE